MNTRVMDRPPVVVYEPNEFGKGTVSPGEVIAQGERDALERIRQAMGAVITVEDHLYLLQSYANTRSASLWIDADSGTSPWDADA